MSQEEKQRMIQEYVPGKQVTLAHVIAKPSASIYEKIGVMEHSGGAIGILTITPSEAAIIAVDIALKSANIEICFLDRFSGAVVITGDVSAVESALRSVLGGLETILGFTGTQVTRT